MKKILFIFLAFIISSAIWAQEKQINDANAEKREVKPFRSIRVSDGIDLYLTQSNNQVVAISASRDEYKSRLKTEVEDGVLKIYYDHESLSDWSGSNKKLKVYISFVTLDKLTAVAGSDVVVEGIIKEELLSLYLNSGASFKGNVEVGKLIVEIESGAKMELTGFANTFNVSANSGAYVDAFSFAANKADVRSATGAKIEVHVKDELKLYSSSGGRIFYKGEAVIKDIETKIGSIIRKKD